MFKCNIYASNNAVNCKNNKKSYGYVLMALHELLPHARPLGTGYKNRNFHTLIAYNLCTDCINARTHASVFKFV